MIVSLEILRIVHEDAVDSVDRSDCGQSGVVNLLADHVVALDYALPLGVDDRGVRQHAEKAFDVADLVERDPGGHAQTVVDQWPCGDRPEFADVLRGKANVCSDGRESLNRLVGLLPGRVVMLRTPE